MARELVAEFLGTFWLVLGGTGAAVMAATVVTGDGFPVGIGWIGVSFAFGLTVLTGAYAFGHISGGHFNPAVTLGLFAAGKAEKNELAPYIGSQLLGGIAASGVLVLIANGMPGFNLVESGFAANGYGEHSPQLFSLTSGFITETVMTFVFLLVILGATRRDIPSGFAPIAIGFALVLIHLISIPVTNTSVNPARSTGPALFVGGWAIEQLWLFWLAPILGAVLAGGVYKLFLEKGENEEEAEAAFPGDRD